MAASSFARIPSSSTLKTRKGVSVRGKQGVHVGERAVFHRGAVPIELACEPDAELTLGEECVLGAGVRIVARRAVRIGARCRLGPFVEIRDSDGVHSAPVYIGDDVCISLRAVVDAGSNVGDGSVIAAGAVVAGVIPPRTLAIGNPARHMPLALVENPEATVREYVALARSGRTDGAAPSRSKAQGAALGTPTVPSFKEVRDAILDWLDDNRLFGEARALITDDCESLRERGLIDSLALVQIVAALQHRFAVKLDVGRVARSEDQSIRALAEMVAQSRQP
jgi:acetyltransferase-like isoleucine patch superfamily enzyme/acyl carrier protein